MVRKEGDIFIRRLKMEQLRQWADAQKRMVFTTPWFNAKSVPIFDEERNKEAKRIVRDSVIFINPDKYPVYGMIPNLNSKN